MKKLLPLMLIALVSCGGSGGGNGGSKKISQEQIDQLQDAFLSVPRGQLIVQKNEGALDSLDFDFELNRYVFKVKNTNEETTKVVLKIDGDRLYTHEVERDLVSGETQTSVEVTTMNAEEIRQTLALPGSSLRGDTLSVSLPVDFDTELSAGVNFELRMRADMNINLRDPHCSQRGTMQDVGSRLIQDGTVTTAKPLATNLRTSCPRVLSSAELKAIDLTAVQFCEETESENDEPNCSVQDMSWLTDDL